MTTKFMRNELRERVFRLYDEGPGGSIYTRSLADDVEELVFIGAPLNPDGSFTIGYQKGRDGPTELDFNTESLIIGQMDKYGKPMDENAAEILYTILG